MDPLSIAASSLAFIGACRKLATGLKFLRDLSRAPEEVLALADELTDLQNVLTAVALVTRKRQDTIFLTLLSPLFTKADRILRELCEVCGTCPHRLKEHDECTEQLKAQLLARFKWTRAKSRVGELRERLKIIRLDFSNSLATISLLDLSHITSKLSNLSAGISERSAGETVSGLDLPPQYEATPMQLTTVAKPTVVDVEAQGQPSFAAEKDPPGCVQKVNYPDLKSTPCKRACSCVCHSVYRIKTPHLLESLVGSLLIKSNGLYGMNQACNEWSCRRSASATIRISYRFPDWLLNRMVSSLLVSNSVCGPQLSLVVPRVVSNTSDIFFHAFSGNIDGVAKLLQSGLASPCDISDLFGYTPLHYAVDRGHLNLCRFLLQAGARPQITDSEGNSVTDTAWNKICSRRISSATAAELEEMFKKDEWFEERQFTRLHKIVLNLLVAAQDLEQELSTSTSDIEVADSEGRTPLSWAAESANVSAVETLLRYNAATSSKSVQGMTPLHYAARAPNAACLSLLLKHGACVSAKNKWNQSPLNIACYSQNDASYITPLLDHGADIHERDCYSSTALSCALYNNHHVTARCLIARGANIHGPPDAQGLTGLNDGIENNSHECVALLLEQGANLSIAGVDDETALHVLARRGDLRTMEIFLAADHLDGLDPGAKTTAGLTAWDLMRQRVGVTEEEQGAFRRVMARLDSRSNCCVTYFDALEKIPPAAAAGKMPDRVEVRVQEILVD